MKVEFDPHNETELTSVFVMLAVLRGGDMSLPLLDDQAYEVRGNGGNNDLVAPNVIPPAPPAPGVPPPPVPAVPAPPVPAVPAPPAPPAADLSRAEGPDGPALDKSGLPHDPRIHSKPPAINKASGLWRQKRGVDEGLVASVTAELRQAMAAPPAPPAPLADGDGVDDDEVPPVPPPPGEAEAAFGGAGAVPPPPVPAVPAPPAPPAPPPPPAPAADLTFADLMRQVTAMQTAGTLTVQETQEIATSLGITGVRDLIHRPDLIAPFAALLPQAAA